MRPGYMNNNNSEDPEIAEELRTELEATRAAFHELLVSIPAEDWHKLTSNQAWTVCELVFHMTVALRMLPEDVRLIRRLGWTPRPPASLFNWLNERLTRRGARGLTPEEVGEKYDAAHDGVLRLMDTIRDDEWGKGMDYPDWDPLLSGHVTLERLFHYPAQHFESHAEQLRNNLNE